MEKKRPDNVAWDEKSQSWVPGILPYGSNVGAPAIRPTDTGSWKASGVARANKQIHAKFLDLAREYEKLVKEFGWSELVYNAKFNFEPIVGNSYHLYKNKAGEIFLSMISPDEWEMPWLGEFRLTSDHQWIKLNRDDYSQG